MLTFALIVACIYFIIGILALFGKIGNSDNPAEAIFYFCFVILESFVEVCLVITIFRINGS